MNRIPDVIQKINLLQAGGRKHRSASDQTFILRSLITHSKYLNKTLYITSYDYKQCFDKLWLHEAVLSLWRQGLPAEYVKLICNLNEMSHITVKNPLGKTDKFTVRSVTKQGTVMGPMLCGGSVGEYLDERNDGGASIGNVTIPALAFVDDIVNMETEISKVHMAHDSTLLFSERKNQPLNEKKCVIMCVNGRPGDATPVLEINGRTVNCVEDIVYIGDVFNRLGNNNDLVSDRVAKGTRCMISTIAECGDITLGQYTIQTLLMMYKSIFLQTVLFNSGAWSNLSSHNINRLSILQLKYLKRILQAPRSTPNAAVYIELGVRPIEYEIHVRQLNFLHHILALPPEDPVRQVYEQQKRYKYENSWHKEVSSLLKKYELHTDERIIQKLHKMQWKQLVDKKVYLSVISTLNEDCKSKKKLTKFPNLASLKTRKYMFLLSPQDARLMFKVKAQIIDIKCLCQYKYKDTECRLCGEGVEDLKHILTACREVTRSRELELTVDDVHKDDEKKKIHEIVQRVKQFLSKVKDVEQNEVSSTPIEH